MGRKLANVAFFRHLAVLFVGRIDRMKRIEAVFAFGVCVARRSVGCFSAAADVAGDRVGRRSLLAVEAGERGQAEEQKRIPDGQHGDRLAVVRCTLLKSNCGRLWPQEIKNLVAAALLSNLKSRRPLYRRTKLKLRETRGIAKQQRELPDTVLWPGRVRCARLLYARERAFERFECVCDLRAK